MIVWRLSEVGPALRAGQIAATQKVARCFSPRSEPHERSPNPRGTWRALSVLFASLALCSPVFAAEPAATKPVSFEKDVTPLLQKYCYDCHGDGAHKGGVQLDGFQSDADLRDPALWLRVLRNTRAHIMPPADEDVLAEADIDQLAAWIKRDAFGLDPRFPDPGRVTVRRLNRVEYRNTVRDLLGIEFDTLKEFPADDTGHGFDNIGDVLTISPMLLEKYLDAAQEVVARAVPTRPRVVAEQIITGVIKPGERLDERDLAERIEVSRTPIREALRGLQERGLVEIMPRRDRS